MNRPRPAPRTTTPRPTGTRRLPLVAAVLAVVVVLVAVVTVVNAVGGDDDTVTVGTGPGRSDGGAADAVAEQAPVTITGTSLTRYDGGAERDPAVGQDAPLVEGIAFDGSPSSVGGSGRRQLLVFLAHWCPHCNREVPRIVSWMAAGKVPEGTAVTAVVTGTDPSLPNYPPSAWLADDGWQSAVLLDDDGYEAGQAFGLSAYPFMVVVDADGKVAARTSGELSEEQLDELVAA